MASVDGITLPEGGDGETRGNYALYNGDVYENRPLKLPYDGPQGTVDFLSLTSCPNLTYALTGPLSTYRRFLC
jgi:hypothetical protein